MGDNRTNRVFDPGRDLLGAEVVNHERRNLKRLAVCSPIGEVGIGVVAGSDAVEQIMIIPEKPRVTLGQYGAKSSYGEMCFPAARIAHEQKAGPRLVRESTHVLPHGHERHKNSVAGIRVFGPRNVEVLKRSFRVKRWDVGALLQSLGFSCQEAGAAFGATDAGAFDDDPAGAAALFANRLRGHYSYYGADAQTGWIDRKSTR